MPPRPKGQDRFQRLIDGLYAALRAAFRAAGWKVQFDAREGHPDLIVRRGDRAYVVELQVAREPRSNDLPAMLAHAALRARLWSKQLDVEPLPVVGADRISPALHALLEKDARRLLPGVAWGAIDGRGALRLHGPGLEVLHAAPVREAPPPPGPRLRFSDLEQWMLKVLVGQMLPEEIIHVPRARIANSFQLAQIAGVSASRAAALVRALQAAGFAEASRRQLRLVRIPELLEAWRRAARPAADIGAIPVLPGGDPPGRMASALRGHAGRACLGLFAASDALGLGFVRGVPTHVLAAELDASLFRRLGLRPARKGEAFDIALRRPSTPESVFRAVVRRDGVAVADVLQCWIDVSDDPARGIEQAEQIYRRAIGPALKER